MYCGNADNMPRWSVSTSRAPSRAATKRSGPVRAGPRFLEPSQLRRLTAAGLRVFEAVFVVVERLDQQFDEAFRVLGGQPHEFCAEFAMLVDQHLVAGFP